MFSTGQTPRDLLRKCIELDAKRFLEGQHDPGLSLEILKQSLIKYPISDKLRDTLIATLLKDPDAGEDPHMRVDKFREQFITKTFPTPEDFTFGTLFRAPPKQMQVSSDALGAYRTKYAETMQKEYPFRLVESRHTGLPALLNGNLSESNEKPLERAEEWFWGDAAVGMLPAQAILGVKDINLAKTLLQRDEYPEPGFGNQTWHFRYRQWFNKDFPVLGGGVCLHVSPELKRVSVSSSYIPLQQNDINLNQPLIEKKEAIATAWDALLEVVTLVEPRLVGSAMVGLYDRRLENWKGRQGEAKPPVWGTLETRAAVRILNWVERVRGEPLAELKKWKDEGAVESSEVLNQLWLKTREQAVQLGMQNWLVDAARYLGKEVCVFPYAVGGEGKYTLAYEIQFTSETGDAAWRVIVDAQTNKVVGTPEDLIAHANVYDTSEQVRANALPTALTPAQLDSLTNGNNPPQSNRVDIFEFEYHPDSSLNGAIDLRPANVNAALGISVLGATSVQLNRMDRMNEAVNIAWHGRRIYNHFITVGKVPSANLNQYRRANGGTQVAPTVKIMVGRKGESMEVGYNPTQLLDPKVIHFQSDKTGKIGLTSGIANQPIFNPSFDPEVVMHEITHALMWMLSPDPFKEHDSVVPFASALREGYANYFAHSIGARIAPVSDTWASASYPKTKWGNQWALPGIGTTVGTDLFAAPNLWPNEKIENIDVYNVGMIWARALWSIRNLLGADLTDKLALSALTYLGGLVTNFEQAAEGFIDSASHDATAQNLVNDIIGLFADRRILAQRGIQSIAPARTAGGALVVLAGTDFGVWRSDDEGKTWLGWGQRSTNPEALGAIALAEQNQIVYAAAEDGIYQRALNAAAWTPLGDWITDTVSQRPTSLVAVASGVYVGTGQGVWHFDSNTQKWQSWDENNALRLAVIVQLANMKRTSTGDSYRYANQFRSVNYRREGAANLTWNGTGNMVVAGNAVIPLVSSMAATDNTVFIGTLGGSVWQQTWNGGNTPQAWQQIVVPATLQNSPVLTLALTQNNLWAGTLTGLFQINLGVNPITVTQVAVPVIVPPPLWITSILEVNGHLLVGTARHGLWWRFAANDDLQLVLNDVPI